MIAFVEKELNGRVNYDSIKFGFFNSWGSLMMCSNQKLLGFNLGLKTVTGNHQITFIGSRGYPAVGYP